MTLPVSARGGFARYLRPEDAVWVLLFVALAILGPDRTPTAIAFLCALGLFQFIEPKVPFFATGPGTVWAFAIKLALAYLLIAWTDGIASSYFWALLLPVVSGATAFEFLGTLIAALLACAAYLSFLAFLMPGQYIPVDQQRELALRVLVFPVVGFLTHRVAQAAREQARMHQATAQQLAEANRSLQEAEAAVRRSDRLAALGQLSAGLAHELRNPLGTMKASAELLSNNLANPAAPNPELAQELAGFIGEEVDRTNSLITRFLDFARPLAVRPERADITQVIDRAVTQVENHRPPFDVSIYKNYPPGLRPFPFDAELMERVIYNLVVNAAQASPPRSVVTVKVRELDDNVEISVIDSGAGIDPAHMENIFNPFFTTKPAGVGLGLAIVSKIIDEHGGRVTVESGLGHGSIFRIYLPSGENR